jgi:hypothetical protein
MTQRNQTAYVVWNKKLCALAIVLFNLMIADQACADIETPNISEADAVTQKSVVESHQYASVQSGYRFITPDGTLAAASPYGRLKSGVSGGFSAGTLGADLKLTVDGSFLHEDDYHTELFFDYGGLVRFHAESTALWHNLLREQVNPGTLELRTLDKNVTYGTRTAITQAETRIKLGNNPIHLNLGYWELKREGYEQLRFSDHYFGTAASSVITDVKRINSITREGNIGLDAHLGLLNLSYGFRLRDFSNEAADPRYTFTNNAGGTLTPGSHAHDVVPDNRVTSHTIKLFSDLSGGLVGTASYNLTQRENNGGHGDTVSSEHPSDVIHSVAGDLTYTPSRQHSFALKYRHREIDRSTPASLYYPYSQITDSSSGVYTTTTGELLVRPATSSVKDTLTFSTTFRPAPKVIYRLEYNAELETRNNVRDAQATADSTTAVHSDSRQTHTGTATFYWKPVTGVKVNASYSYATCDNPSYVASFSDRHIGKLLVTYAANGKWGATGSFIAQHETGEQTASTVSPAPVAAYKLPRESRSGSANASIWFSPLERLTVTTHYSYLEADTNQSTLYSNLIADSSPLVVSNYHSSSHVYGIDAVYSVVEPLDISLAFQQVRSQARYEVPDRSFTLAGVTGEFSTAGITDLTRLDTTETGVSVRLDWRINALLGCSLDYSFKMYESGQPLYDGSVHSTIATLKARW